MWRALMLTSLLGILALAVVWAIHVWSSVEAQMSGHGYFAMALGIVFSIAVGVGLMGLVFYSSRRGYDRDAGGRDEEP